MKKKRKTEIDVLAFPERQIIFSGNSTILLLKRNLAENKYSALIKKGNLSTFKTFMDPNIPLEARFDHHELTEILPLCTSLIQSFSSPPECSEVSEQS